MELDGEPDGEKDLGEELGDLVCGRSDHLSVPTEHTYRLSQSVSSSASQTCPGHTNVAGRVSSRTGLGSTSRESGVNIACTVN